LLGAFLIPIGVSSLHGLTHVVTCKQATNVPFSVSVPNGAVPTLSSAATFERNDPGTLCGGLTLDMRVGRVDANTVLITMPVTNHSRHAWQGTVKLNLGSTPVPARIGRVPAGQTRTTKLRYTIHPGMTEINGSLLIGP